MSEIKRVPQRSEVPEEYHWNTADVFPSDEAWEAAFAEAQTMPRQLAAFAGHLGESAETLCRYITESIRIERAFERLYSYASLKYDEDTRVAKYQDMDGRIGTLGVQLSSATSFELPELMSIPEEKMEQFYRDEPRLEHFRRYFTIQREKKEHILSDTEERLLAAAGEVAGVPGDVFYKLSNADLKFSDALDSDGRAHPVSDGSYGLCMESGDRTLRQNAFRSMYAGYGSMKNTLAAALGGQMKQLKFYAEARRYPNTLSAALASTRVPEAVYHNLIDTVNRNLDKLHRYVALRKKLLGLDELHMYDIYVPMVRDVEMNIPFQQAKETVYEALAPMGEAYRAVLKRGFDERWIDVYENEGKRSGAYSSGSSEPHPFVLLNHKDNLDSMFTLAHEMGHAMHSYHSTHGQEDPYKNYVIFVAEVASTCNEALLMEHLLAHTTDKKERAYLLNHFLDQFRGTLYRQTQFAEFELRMNELTAQGQPLTAELLCKEYKALNEKYYGPDMISDEEIALEWARIPHFYYNYYVYQYATGYSAAIALSRRILREGESAVKDYMAFLSGGCSKDPIDLLKLAGVDMASPAPIQNALDLFDSLLDEMESLMA